MRTPQEVKVQYARWRYRNTMLLALSFLLLYFIADARPVTAIIDGLGSWGWIGIFVTGIFFTSTFTVIPAIYVLFQLAHIFTVPEIVIIGGLGAVIGDFIIFRFFRDRVLSEWEPLFHYLGKSHLARTLHTPFFAWLAPVIGAIIIASPLPDEFGIGLLGIARLKTWEFVVLSFAMNMFGLLIVVASALAW